MAVRVLVGDALTRLRELPDESVQTCVTSPPYWGLRDYGVVGQLGLEKTPDEYVARMVEVFREVRRVLRKDGTLWLNIGDSYAAQRGGTAMPAETLAGGVGGKGDKSAHRGRRANSVNGGRQDVTSPEFRTGPVAHRNAAAFGLKHKDLVGIPWRLAFALRADGWYLRSDIIWAKPNPMPESVTDRPTKAHEYVFLLSKSASYFYDAEAIAEEATPGEHTTTEKSFGGQAAGLQVVPTGNQVPGKTWTWGATRNKRTVWAIATQPFKESHFATMPPELAETCIKAGSAKTSVVLDPFGGAGTTGLVADRLGRDAILCELNPEYARMAERRIKQDNPMFTEVHVA